MKKSIVMAVVVAMLAVLLVPVTAQAAGDSEPSRTQSEYTGGAEVPPGNGDVDCLRTQDRLYDGSCEAECDGEQARTQTRTQTQTQTQTRAQTQEMTGEGIPTEDAEAVQSEVKAQVKAGDEGETPEQTPVAAAVHAETRAGGGFFGDVFAGLQRLALRFMSWLGLS